MNNETEYNLLLQEVFRRTSGGVEPGLEVVSDLLAALGNPEQKLLCIHVAGTNGKGSVCAMLSAILRNSGFRVGGYTSPHLVELTERFHVNGEAISRECCMVLLKRLLAVDAERVEQSGRRAATFFELTTALAFSWLAEEQVDVAVIETGMGGEWDATNVIIPVLSVITGISMDHSDFLGTTLEGIAGEKAGIIKKGRPVVAAPQEAVVKAVLQSRATACGTVITWADEQISIGARIAGLTGQKLHVDSQQAGYGTLQLGLAGVHQAQNCAVAIAAYEVLCEQITMDIDPKAVRRGVKTVIWPGRFQVLNRDPLIICDGAHNEAAAACLVETWQEVFGKKAGKAIVICGFLKDKEWPKMIRHLQTIASSCRVVPVDNSRTAQPDNVAAEWQHCGVLVQAEKDLSNALRAAKEDAAQTGHPILICGSLYLVGEVMKHEII